MLRISTLIAGAALLLAVPLAQTQFAQAQDNYPNRPIKINRDLAAGLLGRG